MFNKSKYILGILAGTFLSSEIAIAAVFDISTQSDFNTYKNATFANGDIIRFQRGKVFTGKFEPTRTGTATITIGAYGSGDKPIINGNGIDGGALEIRDSGGWTIEDIEIWNNGTDGERIGIFFRAQNTGTHDNIIIRDSTVRNVFGTPQDKDTGGIVFRVYGNNAETKYTNVTIENNLIRDVGAVGIRIKSNWGCSTADTRGIQGDCDGRVEFENLVISNNIIRDTRKNAIAFAEAESPLIELNRFGPNISTDYTGNSIFNFSTDNAVMQNNEAYDNVGPATDQDRSGFAAGWASYGTLIQYNYSHDNNSAFMIAKKFNDNPKFRYNISENENDALIYYAFPSFDDLVSADFYNNTFYNDNSNVRIFSNYDGSPRKPINTSFKNNIFHFTSTGATWGFDPFPTADNNIVKRNVFYNFPPSNKGSQARTYDSDFKDGGNGGNKIDLTDPNRLDGYRLCNTSSAIDDGLEIGGNGDVDYWGTTIGVSTNIGAYEGSGVNC